MADLLPDLQQQLRLVVIYNGDKSRSGAVINETSNPRALKSYRPVAEDIAGGLEASGFRHVSLLPDDLNLASQIVRHDLQFCWVNSAGVQGYDAAGHTPGLLEMLGLPYVGHAPADALMLDSKHLFKQAAAALGIPTAPFVTWNPVQDPAVDPGLDAGDEFWTAAFGDYAGPFIVKPVSGRASLNVHYVENRTDLGAVVGEVYADTKNTVLVETYLSGREFTVSVAGPTRYRDETLEPLDQPFVISVVERVLQQDERIFTSMDKRPITTSRAQTLDREDEPSLYDAIATLGRRVFQRYRLNTLIRVDIRADESGGLHVLEVNPKPDLTRPRGEKVPLAAMGLPGLGMSYEDLLLSLLMDRLRFYAAYRPGCLKHIPALRSVVAG